MLMDIEHTSPLKSLRVIYQLAEGEKKLSKQKDFLNKKKTCL